MEFPENLKYSKEHTWAMLTGDVATIGITDFAQSELGEIVYVDLPRIGQVFKQGEVFGSVEAIKTVSDLFMPISGSVIGSNPRLKGEPTLINNLPFADGWIVKAKVASKSEFDTLLSASEYKTSVNA